MGSRLYVFIFKRGKGIKGFNLQFLFFFFFDVDFSYC